MVTAFLLVAGWAAMSGAAARLHDCCYHTDEPEKAPSWGERESRARRRAWRAAGRAVAGVAWPVTIPWVVGDQAVKAYLEAARREYRAKALSAPELSNRMLSQESTR